MYAILLVIQVMLLRNHGFVVCGQSVEDALHLAFHTVIACETQIIICGGDGCVVVGETIEEAVFLMRNLVAACDHQVRAARAGIENLVIPDQKAVEKAYKTARNGGESKKHISIIKIINKFKKWSCYKVIVTKFKICKTLAASGFDPPTSGLWAQHASTAPRCFQCIAFVSTFNDFFLYKLMFYIYIWKRFVIILLRYLHYFILFALYSTHPMILFDHKAEAISMILIVSCVYSLLVFHVFAYKFMVFVCFSMEIRRKKESMFSIEFYISFRVGHISSFNRQIMIFLLCLLFVLVVMLTSSSKLFAGFEQNMDNTIASLNKLDAIIDSMNEQCTAIENK
uniref:Aldolase_II domain-containing protein n=1 Tax=Heterorhabditis bacteriophora TaxID=37862 RepID=A0A1I7X1D7_HETBA